MDRRSFVVGLFGLAGATVVASVARPLTAVAGVPGDGLSNGTGILDLIDEPETGLAEPPQELEPELVWHRGRRHYRPRRRLVWRRVCRRVWYRGRLRRRCYRARVWVRLY